MKRILSAVLVLVMLFALVPSVTVGVFAEDEVIADRTQEPVIIKNGEYEFTINKTVFEVGEPILVSANSLESQGHTQKSAALEPCETNLQQRAESKK